MLEYMCPLCGERYPIERGGHLYGFQYKDKKLKGKYTLYDGAPCYKCEAKIEKAKKEAEKAIIAQRKI